MSFGKRSAAAPAPLPAATFGEAGAEVVNAISSLIAGAIGAWVTLQVVWPMLGIPAELRPFGGIQLDSMPAVTRLWAPAWIPPVVVGILMALIWRRVVLRGGKANTKRGAIAMAMLFPIAFLVSFEALTLGNFIQGWPLMDEPWLMLVFFADSILGGYGAAATYILFFAPWSVAAAIVGALLGGATRLALARLKT